MSGSAERVRRALAGHGGPYIAPALLECDFTRLGEIMAEAEAAGARVFHLDVMDGHFVPNLTYGPPVIRSLRRATELPLDAHLMISNPEAYIDDYCQAGCDIVTIHAEALPNPRPVLDRIRARGALAGIALSPPTRVDAIAPWLDAVDLVLPLSVMPGFGGQSFQADVLEKFRWLRKHASAALLLEGDGGLNRQTIASVAEAGADLLVVGSALFRAKDFRAEFQALQALVGHNL